MTPTNDPFASVRVTSNEKEEDPFASVRAKPIEKESAGLFGDITGISKQELGNRTDLARRQSATAILAGQGLSLDQIQKLEQQNPGFLLNLYDNLIESGSDVPLMLASGALGAIPGASYGAGFGPAGAAVGGAVTGGATAGAVPTLIKQIYRQWLEHEAQGGELTLPEFAQRAANVLDPTLKSAVIGAFTGTGGTLAGAGEKGLAQAATKAAGAFTGLETGKGAVGEFNIEELPEDLANVAAYEAARAGRKGLKKLGQKGIQSGKKFGKEISNIAEDVGNQVEKMGLKIGKQIGGRIDEEPPASPISPSVPRIPPNLPGGIAPEDELGLRPSAYETRERIAEALTEPGVEPRKPTEAELAAQQAASQRKGESLQGRVRVGGRDIGVRPTREAIPSAENDVGTVFSANTIDNPTIAAEALKNTVNEVAAERNNQVRQAYDEAEELTQNISPAHIGLVENLERQGAELDHISAKSGPQKQKLAKIDEILGDLATIAVEPETGRRFVTGYLPRSVADLLEQVQSINQSVDFDFNEARPSGIFLPLSAALNEAAVFATQDHPEAAAAINNARDIYIHFNHDFNNDIIKSYRDTSNHEYLKLYDKALDVDTLRRLKNILDQNQVGRAQTQAFERALVDKVLKKYLKNPKLIREPEFNQELNRLRSIMTPQQAQQIRQILSRYQRPQAQGIKLSQPTKTKPEKRVTPEDIEKMFNNRTQIKMLRKKLHDLNMDKEFEELAAEKVLEILTGGLSENINMKTIDLYNNIIRTKDVELLRELLGEQETQRVLKELREHIKEEHKRAEEMKNKSKEEREKEKEKEAKEQKLKSIIKSVASITFKSAILSKAINLAHKIYK
jgi:hypothetical protein